MSMFDVSVGCRVSVDPSRPNGIISISPLGPGYGIVGSEQIVGQPLNIPAISSIFPAEIHIGGNRRWRIDTYYVPPSPIVSWTKYSRTRVVGRNSGPAPISAMERRSEEHTSELQSLMRISYAVFCWKKKTKY